MRKNIFLFIFTLIFCVGIFLRFFDLGKTPNSLDWDEVSWGYSAYSILLTGKDEYGFSYPLSFKAFGDYKQPLYIYADVLPVKLFGLTPFGTRFPSAFFGSLSIIFVFFLTKELFRKIKQKDVVALLSMTFFALSPWSIQFSRVAFEANVALFFVISGVWLFWVALRTQKLWQFLLATVFLTLSTFTYHSEKLFAPILFVGLLAFGFSFFKNSKKTLAIILGVFLVCNLIWAIDARTTERGRGVLFVAKSANLLEKSSKELAYDKEHGDLVGQLVHNRRVVFAQTYLRNYLQHFDPLWLFIYGDNGRHHTPGMGNLLLIELPFILLGIFFIIRDGFSRTWIIFYWFLAAPLASALAQDAPNASRSLVFLPTWQIFAAYGAYSLFRFIQNKQIQMLGIALCLILGIANYLFFLHQYFVHINKDAGSFWQFGYKEAILYTEKERKNNEKVLYASDLEQPYIFYLFYTTYNPAKYISSGGSYRLRDSCFSIDSALFGNCEDKMEINDYMVTSKEPPLAHMNLIRSILYGDGQPAVYIYQKQ